MYTLSGEVARLEEAGCRCIKNKSIIHFISCMNFVLMFSVLVSIMVLVLSLPFPLSHHI